MTFPRQQYWHWLPFLLPGALPDPRMEPGSPALTGGFFTTELPRKPIIKLRVVLYNHIQGAMGEIATNPTWEITLLFGESRGQRSLAGYSPWGCKKSNTTDRLSLTQLTKVRRNFSGKEGVKEYPKLGDTAHAKVLRHGRLCCPQDTMRSPIMQKSAVLGVRRHSRDRAQQMKSRS